LPAIPAEPDAKKSARSARKPARAFGVKRLFSVKDFKANLLKFPQIDVQLLQIDFIEHDPSGLYKPRGQRLTNRETIKLLNL